MEFLEESDPTLKIFPEIIVKLRDLRKIWRAEKSSMRNYWEVNKHLKSHANYDNLVFF